MNIVHVQNPIFCYNDKRGALELVGVHFDENVVIYY